MDPKHKQAYAEVPPQIQMEVAMDRLSRYVRVELNLPSPQPAASMDLPPFQPSGSNNLPRCSHLAPFQQKKIVRNIDDLRLKSIAVIGLSGIGGIVAEMFARSNVNKLILADKGVVKMASMGRMFHTPDQVGMSKAQAARLHLRRLNSQVTVEALHCDVVDDLDYDALLSILQDVKTRYRDGDDHAASIGADIIISSLDNRAARLRVNQMALQLSIPLVDVTLSPCSSYISIQSVFPGYSACYQCHRSATSRNDDEATLADTIAQLHPATLPQSELLAAGLASQCALKLLLEFGDAIPFYRVDCLELAVSTFWFRPSSECSEALCTVRQAEYKAEIIRRNITGILPADDASL